MSDVATATIIVLWESELRAAAMRAARALAKRQPVVVTEKPNA